jgi:hypothetical protein
VFAVNLNGVAYSLPEAGDTGYGASLVALLQALVAGFPPAGAYYIATETGANNALVAALTNAAGVVVVPTAGLRIMLKTGHTTQSGVNTFALNGGVAAAIRKHTNTASTLTTTYASGGVLDLVYDGTYWLDMSQ